MITVTAVVQGDLVLDVDGTEREISGPLMPQGGLGEEYRS